LTRIQIVIAALGLSCVVSLVLAPPAVADNCDIFINPADCQNTGWTIGVIATLAGGVTVATVATLTGTRDGDTDKREPRPPPTPPRVRVNRDLRKEDEKDAAATNIEIRPVIGAPSIAIRPVGGVVRSHSIRLEVHRDLGWQTIQEVTHGRD
jgi:hypothetical protein